MSPVSRHPDVKPRRGQHHESGTGARNCDENLQMQAGTGNTAHMESIQFITNRAPHKYRVLCLTEARIYLAGEVL